MIKVYDIQNNSFRDINSSMREGGFVLFERSAVSVLNQYYNICGYFYLDIIRRSIHIIDINDELLAIPEAYFSNMIDNCKNKIEKYNVIANINYHPSLVFLSLDMGEKYYDESDCFANLCFEIMYNPILINSFAKMNDSIIYPISEQELYAFAQNVFKLTHFDYISPDYDTSFKYTIDSLINGYHINFSKDDIEKFAYNISRLAYEKVAEYNG